MCPVLLDLYGFRLYTYSAATILAFFIGTVLVLRANSRQELPLDIGFGLAVWLWLGSSLGARIYWIVEYGNPEYLWNLFGENVRGKVFYGGLIGGLITGFVYSRRRHIDYANLVELVVPYLALGEAIVRVGCFLNGCCWGSPTNLPWGISTEPSARGAFAQQINDGLIPFYADHSLPIHPVQIYGSIGLLLLYGFLGSLRNEWHPKGLLLCTYFTAYGLLRFLLEYLRVDCPRYPPFNWSHSQTLSIIVAVVASVACVALLLGPPLLRRDRHGTGAG